MHVITNSGRSIELTTLPIDQDFDINDIAHHLAMICRFGGATDEFYSVAQHSVIVSRYVEKEYQFAALLHDASEAYLGDMVEPLKMLLPDYQRIESAMQVAINAHYDLNYQCYEGAYRDIDLMVRYEEAKCLGVPLIRPKNFFTKLDGMKINPLPPKAAKKLFLERFAELKAS